MKTLLKVAQKSDKEVYDTMYNELLQREHGDGPSSQLKGFEADQIKDEYVRDMPSFIYGPKEKRIEMLDQSIKQKKEKPDFGVDLDKAGIEEGKTYQLSPALVPANEDTA